jgi:preprotein translocase subunit YajC
MSDGVAPLLLPAMIIILLAFMFWSQRRRQSAIARLQESLSVGDDICTTSGLFGRITALDEVTATLEVAPGTRIRFDRRAIATKVDTSGRPLTGGSGQAVAEPQPRTEAERRTRPAEPFDAPRSDTEK